MTEHVGILDSLRLHDSAIHSRALVHENVLLVEITIAGNLTTSLPIAIDISAARNRATWAGEVATEVTSIQRIRDASWRGRGTINTREEHAVDAIRAAILSLVNRLLATVGRITIAVSVASVAIEDALTTSIDVGNITVAVRLNGVINIEALATLLEVGKEPAIISLVGSSGEA